jgi:hypothetical protein
MQRMQCFIFMVCWVKKGSTSWVAHIAEAHGPTRGWIAHLVATRAAQLLQVYSARRASLQVSINEEARAAGRIAQ